MKLIMEGWRSWAVTKKLVGDKFMHDPRGPIDIDEESIPFALHIDTVELDDEEETLTHNIEGERRLVLYRPIVKSEDISSDGLNTNVLGMIVLEDTGDSCIPKTYQVRYSAVAGKGKGHGSLMYGLAFRFANINGYGLTSDHAMSTSSDAKVLWNKFADTKGMTKKKTKAGNDKFDYYEKTADKQDDCWGGGDEEFIATDHSWVDKNNKFSDVFDKLRAQHTEYMKHLNSDEKEEFIESIRKQSRSLFGRVYVSE